MNVIAIILAAGLGKRMKGIDKVFFKIKGRPLIFYAIRAFESHPQIKNIVVVTGKNNFEKFRSLAKDSNFKKIAKITEGGKERQDSTLKGLEAAGALGAEENDLILFHNGANPLVSEKEISETIKMAKKYGAALVGQMSRDTVKEIDENGFIIKTLDRKKIFLAQTPQAMKYGLAKKTLQKAVLEKFSATDDVSLVERMGRKVKTVEAGRQNIKVTYPEDLKIVENFLSR